MTREPTIQTIRRRRLTDPLRRLAVEKTGASFTLVAFALPVVLAMAGLGMDVSMWYLDRRENQTLADNLALALTMEANRVNSGISSDQEYLDYAKLEAERVGFVVDGVKQKIEVTRPANCGPGGTLTTCVEVIVSEETELLLASFTPIGPVTVRARAVGSLTSAGSHCILALDPVEDGAVDFNGTANANVACGIASNSSSDQSITVSGTANITADPIQTYGQIYESGSGTLTTQTPPQPLSERLADPYAGIDVLSYDYASRPCKNEGPVNSDKEWFPDKYCGGIKLTGGVSRFNPGVYIIYDGDLDISTGGNVTVTNALAGEGVTFVLTGSTPAKIGNIKVTASGNITLNAPGADGHFPSNAAHPDHGTYPGILVYQDPRVDCCQGAQFVKNLFTGGPNMTLDGALYFPKQELVFEGGNANNGACTLLVSAKVTFQGTSHIENKKQDCIDAGVDGVIAQTRVRVVE